MYQSKRTTVNLLAVLFSARASVTPPDQSDRRIQQCCGMNVISCSFVRVLRI